MSNGVTEPANAVARLERLPPPLRPGTEGWALAPPSKPWRPKALGGPAFSAPSA